MNDMYALIRELYPICRSITGDGVRRTLAILARDLPIRMLSAPSGARVLDWIVPPEWNIADAYVQDRQGRRVVDFHESNLHVVGYSVPVRRRMTLAELRPHLHTLPAHPDWIPYRTSYYRESWGFCLSQRQLDGMSDGEYEVCIDSRLEPGELLIGEAVFAGESPGEILVWTHLCHPSLCNDNLSGIAVAALLARRIGSGRRRHTFRFVFAPATIGAITWLALRRDVTSAIRHGLVLASLGDRGRLTYKRSRHGQCDVDRAAAHVIGRTYRGSVEDFTPYGYDERQFCSPGFDLPVGRLTRTPEGRYPEYHTSADNLHFITPEALGESLAACQEIMATLERNCTYVNQLPLGEPRLGPRGLFRDTGGQSPSDFEHALLWVLNQSDGGHDLLAIAERSDLPFSLLSGAADALCAAGLLSPSGHDGASGRAP